MTPGFDSVGFKKYQENLDCEVFNKVIDAVKALNIEIAIELLKKHHYDLHRMAHEETTAEVLNSIDSTSDNPYPSGTIVQQRRLDAFFT